jgi:ribosomal protein S13
MPGFGSIRAQAILDRVGISSTRRIKGLGSTQRKKLEEELKGR